MHGLHTVVRLNGNFLPLLHPFFYFAPFGLQKDDFKTYERVRTGAEKLHHSWPVKNITLLFEGFTTNGVLHLQLDPSSDPMRVVTTFCTWLPYNTYVLVPFSKGCLHQNP